MSTKDKYNLLSVGSSFMRNSLREGWDTRAGGGRGIMWGRSDPMVKSSARTCSLEGEQVNSSLVKRFNPLASRHCRYAFDISWSVKIEGFKRKRSDWSVR